MNVLFATLLSAHLLLSLAPRRLSPQLAVGIAGVIQMNIVLCLFNLLPIPPLDGGAILARFVPRRHDNILDGLNRYGFIILFALLMTGLLTTLMWPAQIVGQAWIEQLAHWATA